MLVSRLTPRAAPRAAEFFAGIGLVRRGLEQAGAQVVWANDIEPVKAKVYASNFSADHYRLGDVREVHATDLPENIAIATASFPCVDLSLAGWRRGLDGKESGMFWEFARVLDEMGDDRPGAVLLENVPAFVTSHGGRDLEAAIQRLNDLGYTCDLLVVDARHFVAQSRPRLFIVGSQTRFSTTLPPTGDPLRPASLLRFLEAHQHLDVQFADLGPLPLAAEPLDSYVERLHHRDEAWWSPARTAAFLDSLSPLNRERLATLRRADRLHWRTAYRRTRNGIAVWEIRPDAIAGCLRTARGGSSKQAVVEAGRGNVRVRWMTPREYANLQGAPDLDVSAVTPTQAMFGLGDAVCVPAVAWIASEYLIPIAQGHVPEPVDLRRVG